MTFYKPAVPTIILRHPKLTYQQKAFLLWCWDCRENDDRCNLISKRQDCRLRDKTIQDYANFFGIRRASLSEMFSSFREVGILKIEEIGTRNEVVYIDFTLFT
jgi:hypothetical protein